MFQPTRILAALVLAGAATAAQARTPAPMPATMPAALSAPMPAPALRSIPSFRTVTAPALRSIPSFRTVTARGTTKPAGAALDARRGTKPSLDAESRRLDRLIRTAVCTGC